MSLVHQALRKAEQEKQRHAAPTPAPHAVNETRRASVAVDQPITAPDRPAPSTAPATAAISNPASAVAPAATANPSLSIFPVLLSIVTFVAIVAMVFIVIRATTIGPATQDTSTRDNVKTQNDPDPGLPATTTAEPPLPAAAATTAPTPAAVTATSTTTTRAIESQYDLTGITQFPDGRQAAVINGQLRSEDQYVDGAIIKKIERDRVTLDVDGQVLVKRLF